MGKKKSTGKARAKKATGKPATKRSQPAPRSTKKPAGTKRKTPAAGSKPKAAPVPGPAPVAATPRPGFPIVGIGASAGGLEAFEIFFKAMPSDTGMGFVIVAHLDPSHVSLLPELIQKRTKMPVGQAKDGELVQPNCVYVIPPNRALAILNGTLHLLETSQPRGANLPIDSFLRSLAQDQHHNAIGIILSGTGTDGTLGVRAIKGETGMVMVQDEESAKYDGMPRSAIATGLADYVLPPEKMPQQLIGYAAHAVHRPTPKLPINIEGDVPDALQKIYILLRALTGHDFSQYKVNTICRRIERRMHVHQIDDVADYVRYLQESETEATILFKELLIGVTGFFRDPDAFDVLNQEALHQMLEGRPDDYTVRAWVPGCSTGEEAYSIAISIHEALERLKRHLNVQIFGTDIDEDAVNVARAGLYPASIAADVSAPRLKRYFAKEGDGQYRVAKSIRELLVFAPQNIIKDPPFTKLDLLSCRNLLIYLGPELQKKLLPLFHYSLRPDGLLFLGSSETIGPATDLFHPVDKKWKLFVRKSSGEAARPAMAFPSAEPADRRPAKQVVTPTQEAEEVSALQLVQTILSHSAAPPCVIVDEAGEAIYIHGRTGRYLEPAQGRASASVVEMARPGLKAEITAGLRRAGRDRQEVAYRGLRVQNDGGHLFLDLIVKPILEPGALRGLVMVVFQETEEPGAKGKPAAKLSPARRRNKELETFERELQYTRENLQTTIEELETSNEELKSTNEELQSTNEELETSKEELQSLNEEASTANAELQSRMEELSRANNDMKNLLDNTQIATIFLDADFRLRRFTPAATDLIPLAATDIGRPITHFTTDLIEVDLKDYAERVLNDLGTRMERVETREHRWYRMRALPYRTVQNVIDGVVFTFDDITEHEQSEWRRLAAVVRDSNDAITLQDRHGRIVAWNRGAEQMYGYAETEALEMNIIELVPEDKRTEALSVIERLFRGETVPPLATQRRTKSGEILGIQLTATAIEDNEGCATAVATTERVITGSL